MQRKQLFSSEVTNDGQVRISVIRKNGKPASVDIPPDFVPMITCMMLEDAKEASGTEKSNAKIAGSPVLNPTGIGLSSSETNFPTALVVHMGKARFGVAIAKPRELGEALLALTASKKTTH